MADENRLLPLSGRKNLAVHTIMEPEQMGGRELRSIIRDEGDGVRSSRPPATIPAHRA